MALRKIDEYGPANRTAKVYRDAEWDEYRVKFFIDGAAQKDADYHTNDKQDALDTAANWARYPAIPDAVHKQASLNSQIAKKLNEHHMKTCAGFYQSKGRGGRYFQARVNKGGALEVHDWENWFIVPQAEMQFHDHNGRPIALPTH